jgi:5,10-methylenetetrahydromethanopterin reductase
VPSRHPVDNVNVECDQTVAVRIGLDIVDLTAGVVPRRAIAAVDDVSQAEQQGFVSAWIPQLLGGPDPLAVCAIAAAATRWITLATGVVRIWGHHPVELARAASTVAAAADGRLVLGVGTSHRNIVEQTYGQRFDRPLLHLREYLFVLRSLLTEGRVNFRGETLRAGAQLDVTDHARIPIAVAAGGPKMLATAAEYADIVVTNMVGLRTLETHTVPVVESSAAHAGRSRPDVATVVTICVTARRDVTCDHIDKTLAGYAANPDYRTMLDREGVQRPSDIAIVGDEETVASGLTRYRDAGAGEIVASVKAANPSDETRTRVFLGHMAGMSPSSTRLGPSSRSGQGLRRL